MMMASKLKLIKLLLLLLLPTVFSVEAVVTGCHSQLVGLSAQTLLAVAPLYSTLTPRLDQMLGYFRPGCPGGPLSAPQVPWKAVRAAEDHLPGVVPGPPQHQRLRPAL